MSVEAKFTMTNLFSKSIDQYKAKDSDTIQKALAKAALQFLAWANNGSTQSSRKPPIRWGVLRGSSSAFVGSTHIGNSTTRIQPGAPENPTPNESYSGNKNEIVWGWNTEYAKKMHEWEGGWGPYTTQDGNAGAKWLEEHLQADKDMLMNLIGTFYKKEMGL